MTYGAGDHQLSQMEHLLAGALRCGVYGRVRLRPRPGDYIHPHHLPGSGDPGDSGLRAADHRLDPSAGAHRAGHRRPRRVGQHLHDFSRFHPLGADARLSPDADEIQKRFTRLCLHSFRRLHVALEASTTRSPPLLPAHLEDRGLPAGAADHGHHAAVARRVRLPPGGAEAAAPSRPAARCGAGARPVFQ